MCFKQLGLGAVAQTLKYFDLPCRDSDEGLDSEIFLSSSYRAEIPTKEMQLSFLDFEYFTVYELPCRDSDRARQHVAPSEVDIAT